MSVRVTLLMAAPNQTPVCASPKLQLTTHAEISSAYLLGTYDTRSVPAYKNQTQRLAKKELKKVAYL